MFTRVDCDVELPTSAAGLGVYLGNWLATIGLAQIQSEIYIKLYSAASSMQNLGEWKMAIGELDRKLDEWVEEHRGLMGYGDRGDLTVDFYM